MRRVSSRWPRLVLVALVAAAFTAPLLWMLLSSLKPAEQTYESPPRLLPRPISEVPANLVHNYIGDVAADGAVIHRGVWTDPVVDFPQCLRNTLVIAILSTTGMVFSSAIVAYGMARIRWRGRGIVLLIMLLTMMLPFPIIMGPLYILFRDLGWIGTLRPLWVPAWFGAAFNVLLLRQFYLSIPRELDDAARLDGCSHWGIFTRIIAPLSRPALAVVALLHILTVWNDFLGPLIFLQRRDQFTLALGLHVYQSQSGQVPWNLLMAACAMVIAPMAVLFLLMQRSILRPAADLSVER